MDGQGSSEKLPIGWTEQVAAKDGQQLKFYYNVITGQKFYHKTDLLNYIELGSPAHGTPQQACVEDKGKPENSLMESLHKKLGQIELTQRQHGVTLRDMQRQQKDMQRQLRYMQTDMQRQQTEILAILHRQFPPPAQ